MRLILEVLAPGFPRVPVGLELAQFGDNTIGAVDRILAGSHLAHMNRDAAHLDLKPEHADIGPDKHLLFGLRNENRVCLVASQVSHQRAVPGRLLFDHRLDVDRGRRLKADAATADIPIIMLTARRQERDIVGALELGADDYLVKPFIPEELMSRLARLMATRR